MNEQEETGAPAPTGGEPAADGAAGQEDAKPRVRRARGRRGGRRHKSAAARAAGEPPPLVFSVSQNDWLNPCQCDQCQAIAKAEESEAGPLIDFVNFLADGVKDVVELKCSEFGENIVRHM